MVADIFTVLEEATENMKRAIAEIDRLRALNQQLVEALAELLDVSEFTPNSRTGEIHLRAMAAIRKAAEVSK